MSREQVAVNADMRDPVVMPEVEVVAVMGMMGLDNDSGPSEPSQSGGGSGK